MAGRKSGTPKTGGRKAGTPNKSTADIRLIAQEHTEACIRALVAGLSDPLQFVASAKVLLAYGYGAPRAALDVSVKPIYVMSGKPLSAEEWEAKYGDAPGSSDGNGNGSNRSVSGKPLDKPPKPRPRVGAARRAAKRAR